MCFSPFGAGYPSCAECAGVHFFRYPLNDKMRQVLKDCSYTHFGKCLDSRTFLQSEQGPKRQFLLYFFAICWGLVPGFVSWVPGIVCWVLGIVFWVSGFVFWVLGIVFWVSGFVFGAWNCLLDAWNCLLGAWICLPGVWNCLLGVWICLLGVWTCLLGA